MDWWQRTLAEIHVLQALLLRRRAGWATCDAFEVPEVDEDAAAIHL